MSRLFDLLTHVDRLRAQHRAGEIPPHGEVEALFDMAADVRSELALGRLRVATSTPPAVEPAAAARQGFLSVETVDTAGRVVSRARIPLEPLNPAR